MLCSFTYKITDSQTSYKDKHILLISNQPNVIHLCCCCCCMCNCDLAFSL